MKKITKKYSFEKIKDVIFKREIYFDDKNGYDITYVEVQREI